MSDRGGATGTGDETLDATLASVVDWIEDAEDEGQRARERSERDRDYYDGRQITQTEAAELEARNQPVIAFNLIQSKIDYLLGLEKQQRSDPKAYPRNPDDQEAAESATDGIRYVCDAQNMQMVASQTWENMCVEGCGGVEVCVEPKGEGEFDIVLHQVHWDRMVWDPYSRERDFSDAKFLGAMAWMDEADLLAQWPDAEDVVEWTYTSNGSTSAWDDRPRDNIWADPKRRRVRVVQLYWRVGEEWRCGTFTRGGWLEEPQVSVYLDDEGKPDCPLIFASAYVNRENWRYGVVRNLIDPQDEINLRHRKAVHLLSVRQVTAEQGAVADVDKARQELAKPDGYIEVAPGMRFDISPTQDLSAGQASLLQEAKSMFQNMGPNAALMGKQGNSASGRAIALSQQGGAMEIGAILDVHRHWRRRVYRAIWSRIKQYWTAEKWVRVSDDERNMRWVGINQPVTLEQKLMEMPPEEAQGIAQQMGLMQGDPRLAQVVEIKNDVGQLDVDIIVEEGQDVATLQIENFETLANLAKAGMPIPPDVLIEASSLRNKDKILEKMKSGGAEPGAPPPPPTPEQIEAAAKAKQAEAEAVEAEAKAMMAQIELQRMQMGLDMVPPPAPAMPAAPAIEAPPAMPAAPQVDMVALMREVMDVLRADIRQMAVTMQPPPAPPAMPTRIEIAPEIFQAVNGIGDAIRQGAEAQAMAASLAARPRNVVRDQAGRVVGVE
jgi:hypothetical protein